MVKINQDKDMNKHCCFLKQQNIKFSKSKKGFESDLLVDLAKTVLWNKSNHTYDQALLFSVETRKVLNLNDWLIWWNQSRQRYVFFQTTTKFVFQAKKILNDFGEVFTEDSRLRNQSRQIYDQAVAPLKPGDPLYWSAWEPATYARTILLNTPVCGPCIYIRVFVFVYLYLYLCI